MSNNEKIPKIRFKGFTEDWEQRKLNEFCNYNTSNLSSSDTDKNGIYDLYDANTVIGKTNKNIQKSKYITIIKDGSGVGRVRLMPENTAFTGTMGALINNNSDIYFLYCILSKMDFTKEITGATIPHVYFSTYGNSEHNIPILEEQSRIGTCFTQLDNLITLHQRKCDKLINVKKSMLEKMFPQNDEKIPKIRFKGFTEDWEQRKLGDIGNTFTGLSGKTKEDFGHGDAKFVTYMNVFSNPISNFKQVESIEIDSKQNEIKYGDIFFTTSSETPEEVGMSSIWLENKGNYYLNSFCFGFRPSLKFDPYFAAYMLRTSNVRNKITLLAQGISRYNISKIQMMNIEVPFPKYSEQIKLGKLFVEIDNLITLHQRKLEMLKNVKKSMLDKMFV